jgi:hypothetical protein
MTVRALSRASDTDTIIVRLEGERETLCLPRFWETEDGAARARVLEITAEYDAILAAELGGGADDRA